MQFDSHGDGSPRYCPDGLAETVIDELLMEMRSQAVARSGPTAALADGSAAERKYRRADRRVYEHVVRPLPVRTAAAGPLNEVA